MRSQVLITALVHSRWNQIASPICGGEAHERESDIDASSQHEGVQWWVVVMVATTHTHKAHEVGDAKKTQRQGPFVLAVHTRA